MPISFYRLYPSLSFFRDDPFSKLSHYCEIVPFLRRRLLFMEVAHVQNDDPSYLYLTHFSFVRPVFIKPDPTQISSKCNWLRFLKARIRTMETRYFITESSYSSNHWILLQSVHKSLENHSEEYYCMHHIFLRITSPLATALLFTLCFCKQTGTARLDSTHENKVEVICSHNHTVSIFFSISPFCG
jgi:hypothetical protein